MTVESKTHGGIGRSKRQLTRQRAMKTLFAHACERNDHKKAYNRIQERGATAKMQDKINKKRGFGKKKRVHSITSPAPQGENLSWTHR